MKRRVFLKAIFPSIFIPKLIIPVWKIVKPVTIYEPFGKIIIPQILQGFPPLLIEELVSVQPMKLPIETAFYLDFVTTSTSKDDDAHT